MVACLAAEGLHGRELHPEAPQLVRGSLQALQSRFRTAHPFVWKLIGSSMNFQAGQQVAPVGLAVEVW